MVGGIIGWFDMELPCNDLCVSIAVYGPFRLRQWGLVAGLLGMVHQTLVPTHFCVVLFSVISDLRPINQTPPCLGHNSP